MGGDFFEYVPQFKLPITGNHKPSLRSVDEAIRRRLHLIPHSITVHYAGCPCFTGAPQTATFPSSQESFGQFWLRG